MAKQEEELDDDEEMADEPAEVKDEDEEEEEEEEGGAEDEEDDDDEEGETYDHHAARDQFHDSNADVHSYAVEKILEHAWSEEVRTHPDHKSVSSLTLAPGRSPLPRQMARL